MLFVRFPRAFGQLGALSGLRSYQTTWSRPEPAIRGSGLIRGTPSAMAEPAIRRSNGSRSVGRARASITCLRSRGQEEKCRITLDRVAPFVERGSQADRPAFLELSHLEEADRGHGNPDPTRFGTTDEATELSAEGLLNAAQVEDQRRRIEAPVSRTAWTGRALQTRAATLEPHGELVPELSDGLKDLVGSAEQPDAAAQTCKGPSRASRFRRRRRVRRQPGDWPSAARQHDHLTGAAHLVGDSAEVAARVDDRNALRHLNTGSVHFDFRPPQRG